MAKTKTAKDAKPAWTVAYEHRKGESYAERQSRINAYEASQNRHKPAGMDWGTYWKTY